MVKTSVSDYLVATIMALTIVAVFVVFFVYADFNYDVEDLDTSGLQNLNTFDNVSQQVNSSTSGVYDINADSGLFDVLGGLVVKALSAIKSFISIIKFGITLITSMLGFELFYIPTPIKIAIIMTITISLAAVFLFRYVANREDEK